MVIGAGAEPTSDSVSNEVTIGNTDITKFNLKDNGGTPTQGHVLTVDGSGEASFAAASGGVELYENTVGYQCANIYWYI